MAGNTSETVKQHKISEYTKYDHLVLIYILKGITKEQQALSIPDLAKEMTAYLGDTYSQRTLRRNLGDILDVQNWGTEADRTKRREKKELAQVLYCIFGGRIRTCGGETKKLYYFEPCLDDAAMKMINGTVVSNIFLSEEEKDYLLSRMRLLNMLGDFYESPEVEEDSFNIAPAPQKTGTTFPGLSNLFLRNTIFIDQAINKGKQIEITYGIYDEKEGMVDYHSRKDPEGKPRIYRINPYALFWSSGHYYLLATYAKGWKPEYVAEEGTPVNFRVDRIIGVRYATTALEASKKKGKTIISCESIPARLKEFFYHGAAEGMVFDAESYTARFPAMRISQHQNLIKCRVECTRWSLQVLVDAFGSNMRIKASQAVHDQKELDYNQRPQEFLEAEIEDVEFENMRDFCLANPEYITPLAPKELVDAVREKLEACLGKYR